MQSDYNSYFVQRTKECVFSLKLKKHVSRLFPIDFSKTHLKVKKMLVKMSDTFIAKMVDLHNFSDSKLPNWEPLRRNWIKLDLK